MAFLSTCAGGYPQEIVTAFVSHNYIALDKRAHGAALEMRRCVFLSQGDLVSIVDDAPPAIVDGRELAGYFVAKGAAGRVVWFPQALLTNFSATPAPQPEPEPTTEPDLYGPLPVGRWSVWTMFNPRLFIERKVPWGDYHESEIELIADGSGRRLLFHGEDGRPRAGFRFPAMGSYVWSRGHELSWQWTGAKGSSPAQLVLSGMRGQLTSGNGTYVATTTTRDFISMTSVQRGGEGTWWPHGERLILVRIGSEVYWGLIRFHHCVGDDKGAECLAPFAFDERPSGPLYLE